MSLSAVLGGSAWAADLPMVTKAPVLAPVLAPAWDWNGFYLGAHAGYGWAVDPINGPLFPGESNPSIDNVRSPGALAGFQFGANWQRGVWLTGLEFDISAAGLRGQSSTSGVGPAGGVSTIEQVIASDEFTMLGSARLRLGYLPRPDLLLYATGGPAWTRIDQTSSLNQIGAFTILSVVTAPAFRFGWVAGAGAEMRLANTNWLARLEYLHYDFGDSGNSISTSSANGPGAIVSTSSDITVDVVRAGLSYEFGGPTLAAASAYASAYDWASPAMPAAPASPWSWAGLYAGAHAGYAWLHDPITLFPISGIDGAGGFGGFQAGANWQRGALVGGLEIDLSAGHVRGSSFGSGTQVGTVTTTSSGTAGDDLRLIGSARTRIGYLVTPTTLLYGTGGFAWTQIDRTADSTSSSTFLGATTTSSQSGSTPTWRAGWVAGLGVEQRIAATPWTGRLEYLHYDFGDTGTSIATTTIGGVTTVTAALTSGHLTADELRAGVNYRFGAGSGGARAQADAAPPAATSWSGFYLGVHGGFGVGRFPFDFAGIVDADIKPKGWLAGGQAGASQQFGRWLAGAEIDISTSGMRSSTTGMIAAGGSAEALTAGQTFDLLGSARARLGWLAWPNLLVYGTGGLAWTQATQSFTISTVTTGFGSSSSIATAPTWRWGWVAGLGAETRIAHSDWLGRIEYLHYDFGMTGNSVTVTNGSPTTLDEGRLTADVIRAGLSYQLN